MGTGGFLVFLVLQPHVGVTTVTTHHGLAIAVVMALRRYAEDAVGWNSGSGFWVSRMDSMTF